MLNIKECFTKEKNKNDSISRRQFLLFLATVPLVGTFLYADTPKKVLPHDDFIMVNGWMLKKGDLNAV